MNATQVPVELPGVFGRYTVCNVLRGTHVIYRISWWGGAFGGRGSYTIGVQDGTSRTRFGFVLPALNSAPAQVALFARFDPARTPGADPKWSAHKKVAEHVLFGTHPSLAGRVTSQPEMICRRCPRPLTHPSSQQLGIGPECAANEGIVHRYESATSRAAVICPGCTVPASVALSRQYLETGALDALEALHTPLCVAAGTCY